MKTIFTLLLVCFVCKIQAQTIAYDYETRKYVTVAPGTCLEHGGMVNYQLTNINTRAQKVVINGKVVSLTTEMPAQLTSLFGIKAEADKALANTDSQLKKMDDVNQSISGKAKPTAKDTKLKAELDKLVDACDDYYTKAQKINEALAMQETLTQTLTNKDFNNAARMIVELEARRINGTTMRALANDFDSLEHAYEEVRKRYATTAKAALDAGEKDKAARILSAKEQVEKAYQSLEDQYRKTLSSIDNLYRQAISADTYVAQSKPIKLAGNAGGADEVLFDVKIDDDGFIDAFNVRGGAKIDFSIGPVANFTSDDTYFFTRDSLLRKQDKGKFLQTLTPSIASMMHVYPRTCGSIGFGGMFGVNVNFKELTDINLGFLAGVSAVIPAWGQKIFLSTGVSYSKVTRLKEGQYAMDATSYKGKGIKIDDVTERVLRPAWFLSVSLSLTKRKVLTP